MWHVDKYKITFKLFINYRRISRGPAVEKHWSEPPKFAKGGFRWNGRRKILFFVKDVNLLDKKKVQTQVTKKIQKIMYGRRYKYLMDCMAVCKTLS